jgi:hypothetical protein
MKINKLILLVALVISATVHAQTYGDYDFGSAFRKQANNSPMIALHIGYQFNNVFSVNGVGLLEYDQRTLMEGISPSYFGARIGYGIITGQNTSFSFLGGAYYRLLSDGDVRANYIVPGGGVSFIWKAFTLNVDRVEFYEVSIGCHYLLDD